MARLYTLDEAAEALGVAPEILRDWIAEGRARASRRSGDYVLREHEVEKLKASPPGSTAPAPPPPSASAPATPGAPARPPDPAAPQRPPAPPAPTGLGFPDRRRSPGRRRDDQVSLATLVAQLERALERGLQPLARVQVRMLERLEEVRDGLPSSEPGAERLARLEEQLAGLAGRLEEVRTPAQEAELQVLRGRLAELEARPSAEGEMARELETLRRSSEEALRSLRGELTQLRRTLEEEGSRRAAAERVRDAAEAAREALKAEKDALKEEIARLKAGPPPDQQRLREERDRAVRELEHLRSERERLVDELAEARTDRARSTRFEDEVRTERERLVRERDDLRSALDRATKNALSIGSESQRLGQQREELLRERDALRADRDRVLKELATLRSERDKLATDQQGKGSELGDLIRRLEVLRKPLDAAGANPVELADRAARMLEESRAQRHHLEAKLRTAEKEVLDLRAEVERLKASESKAGQAGALEGLVESLRAELQAARGRLEPLEADLAAARRAVDESRAEAARVKGEREKLLANFEDERRRDAEKADHKEKQYRELEKTLLKLEGERTRLLQKEKALEEDLEAMRSEARNSLGAREHFEEERHRLQEGTARLQGQVNGLQRELDAAQRQLAEGKETQARLAGERDGANEKARQLQEELKSVSYKLSLGGTEKGVSESKEMVATIANLEAETAEKDMLIQQGHKERAELRDDLEKTQRALYEMQQRLERERKEWSEILAREIKQREAQVQAPPPSEEDASRRSSGWRLFKPRGGVP